MSARVLVASVVAPPKLDGDEFAWLLHADRIRQDPAAQHVGFMLAAEIDSRGLAAYGAQRTRGSGWQPAPGSLLDRIRQLDGDLWTYSINEQPYAPSPLKLNSDNRLVRIATGRNLIVEHALRGDWTHVLHLDTDTEPPPDVLSKLLAVDWPVTGFHVPTYGLTGHRVRSRADLRTDGSPTPATTAEHLWADMDLRQHHHPGGMNTAGALLVRRDALRRVRWGWDRDGGLTDDPTYARDITTAGLGPVLTRHDTIGRHHPAAIGPVEHRRGDWTLTHNPHTQERSA